MAIQAEPVRCPYRSSAARAGLANPAQYLSKVVKCLDMSIQAERGGVQLLPTGSRWIDKSSGIWRKL